MVVGTLLAVDGATGGSISGGLSKLGGDIADGIAGWFGGSARDRERRAWVQDYARKAAAGDAAALRQLEFAAFEKRRGLPGDTRTPVDGKASPPTTRGAAADALSRLVAMGATLSQAAYYEKLSLPRPQSVTQQILSPVAGGFAEALRPVVAQEAQGAAAASVRAAVPWLVGALVLALGVVVVARAAR